MSKERILYVDFAAGIMILWMIIYHAVSPAWFFEVLDCFGRENIALPEGAKAFVNADGHLEIINPCIFFPYLSFFMPWFFYKSGQFFKKRSCKELLAKDSRKLLLTFVIWSAIGYVFYLVFGAFQHSLTLRGSTYSILRGLFLTGKAPINEPLWFLLTLFGVRFVANWLLPNQDDKYRWLIVACIIIAGYVISYGCYRWNHPLLPYWVANGASGLVFFVLGYGLREYEDKWWLSLSCIIVYVIYCLVEFPMVTMMNNNPISGDYLLWTPTALCGIVVFNSLCKLLCKYVRLAPLEYVGKNAMIIYVTHILIVQTCNFVVQYFEITSYYPYMLWLYLAGYLVILPLLCYMVHKIPDLTRKFALKRL